MDNGGWKPLFRRRALFKPQNGLFANTRIKLLMIIGLCALPIGLSYLCYFYLKPQGGISYGRLLEVKPFTQRPLLNAEGKNIAATALQGKWLLLIVAGGACDKQCQERLFAIRQYRAGQGINAPRITRVWVIHDGVTVNPALDPELLAGVTIVWSKRVDLDARPFWHQSIFLIDPQGNQVMQYQQGQDHRKIMNEIGKILKDNQVLG